MYRLNKAFLCISFILGYASLANADIINTNGAEVQKIKNGPTIVNINKASDNGVSHNIYSSFDVDKNGVIFNNSSTNSNTILGGEVKGNNNLKTGSSQVILNEVNSNRTSTINGMMEVAGDKAQVIIANPSGITCNSCGFINTERATLTTGKMVDTLNGEITDHGYYVDRGSIIVNGNMKSDSPTDIIARSISIRGNIETKDRLTIIAGSNFVTDDNQAIIPIRPHDNATKYGIDVSSLGGMYSDKITLITTEKGVGVSNNGNIRSSEDILIDSSSSIANYSNIISDGGNITINSPTKIYNKNGNISAKNNLTIKSDHVYNSNGTFQTTMGNINIDADIVDNMACSRNNIYTEVPKGILSSGDINISSRVIENKNTEISAKKNINIKSVNIENDSSLIKSGDNLNINTNKLTNNSGSSIDSGGILTIRSDNLINRGSILFKNKTANINSKNINNNYGLIQGGTLNSISDHFNNESGYINMTGLININARVIHNDNSDSFKKVSSRFGLVNQSGGIQSTGGSINLNSEELYNNFGRITSTKDSRLPIGGDIELNIKRKIQNDKGSIVSFKDINITTSDLNNNNGVIDAKMNTTIKASSSVSNRSGKINANKTTTIESPLINSSKRGVITGDTVVITTNKYIN